jgi:hypothetical protein
MQIYKLKNKLMRSYKKYTYVLIMAITIFIIACNNRDSKPKMPIIAPKHDSTFEEKRLAIEYPILQRFQQLPFDSIIMTGGDPKSGYPIKKIVLPANFRDTLKKIVFNEDLSHGGFTYCFTPRQFFYLFKKKDTAGIISVCQECSKIIYENKLLDEGITVNYTDSGSLLSYSRICSIII